MTTINGTDLIAIGYTPNSAIGVALNIATGLSGLTRDDLSAQFRQILQSPAAFEDHAVFGPLAKALQLEAQRAIDNAVIPLNATTGAYTVFGRENIGEGAIKQMNIAMRLPVAVAGALMPDAHQGYALPIGGVLATRGVVIPYGVGNDIGCRMALTVLDIPVSHFENNRDLYQSVLVNNTHFGAGPGFKPDQRSDHAVLENNLFTEHPIIKNLKDKAWAQLGSSGGGNHFVEFGYIDFPADDLPLGIPKGKYLALLTHSGSRGFGGILAAHYTQLAKSICKLPDEAKNLAWLDLNSAEGNDYWLAMELAGDYAAACHDVIHQKIATALGAQVLAKVENHHNFAWKEQWKGEEVIVHRKGATPAGEGVMGIIPGSMATPGFLVRGKGAAAAVNSASHGAGRQMSRTQANKNISPAEMKAQLAQEGVTLIGGGTDEAPFAYKDIFAIMEAQQALVHSVAQFTPKVVRMADDGSAED
ncbi:RtcB family protein [Chitinophaga sp. Cy-1792]|uniref:RtcB family protein n=1 Tax=Chitinophaga sp. Cy-1792 TaxID=2608339 RepID=UPI001965D623|nr:RtcB family protein [Chitinophaga sp. Cy-1792]